MRPDGASRTWRTRAWGSQFGPFGENVDGLTLVTPDAITASVGGMGDDLDGGLLAFHREACCRPPVMGCCIMVLSAHLPLRHVWIGVVSRTGSC